MESRGDDGHDNLTSHGFDPAHFTRRMSGLYGRVFARQADDILAQVVGKTVLDVGAASGYLSFRLREAGFQPTAIDVVCDSFEFASRQYGVAIERRDVRDSKFPDKAFDCTVMKEVVFHLDLDRCLPEIARITGRRLIIFQGTTNPLLSLGRAVLRHREHNRRSLAHYRQVLRKHGWRIVHLGFHDPLAFYFSGGVVGPVLWPPWKPLCGLLVRADALLNRALGACRLGPWACSRFLLVAEPPESAVPSATPGVSRIAP